MCWTSTILLLAEAGFGTAGVRRGGWVGPVRDLGAQLTHTARAHFWGKHIQALPAFIRQDWWSVVRTAPSPRSPGGTSGVLFLLGGRGRTGLCCRVCDEARQSHGWPDPMLAIDLLQVGDLRKPFCIPLCFTQYLDCPLARSLCWIQDLIQPHGKAWRIYLRKLWGKKVLSCGGAEHLTFELSAHWHLSSFWPGDPAHLQSGLTGFTLLHLVWCGMLVWSTTWTEIVLWTPYSIYNCSLRKNKVYSRVFFYNKRKKRKKPKNSSPLWPLISL